MLFNVVGQDTFDIIELILGLLFPMYNVVASLGKIARIQSQNKLPGSDEI